MHTNRGIVMPFGKGPIQALIVIPPGTRVVPASHGEYFVDDLSFLDRNSMTYHDAYYYGIRLPEADISRTGQPPSPSTD